MTQLQIYDAGHLFKKYELLNKSVDSIKSDINGLAGITQNDMPLTPDNVKDFNNASAALVKKLEGQIGAINAMKALVMKHITECTKNPKELDTQ